MRLRRETDGVNNRRHAMDSAQEVSEYVTQFYREIAEWSRRPAMTPHLSPT